MIWRAAKGWQVENMARFGPSAVILLMMSGARRWYVVGAYMPPNNTPDVHNVKQVLRAASKGLDMILMGDLNARLGDPCDEREEDLATALADRGLVNMTDHLFPRRNYRGSGSWAWSTQREGRRVTGRGDYTLSTDRISFTNAGLRETHFVTDQRMTLTVLQGEGVLRNRSYKRGKTFWPIRPKAVQPQTKGEAAFADLKGETTRAPSLTKARASCIFQKNWILAGRRAVL